MILKMLKIRRISLLLFLYFSISNTYGQSADRIQVTDLLKIKRLSNLKANPDEKWAIFNVSSLDTSRFVKPTSNGKLTTKPNSDSTTATKAGNISNNKLYRVELSGNYEWKEYNSLGNNVSQVTFSPDGKQLAFLRNVKGKSQIFIKDLQTDSTWQLTNGVYGASGLLWSPDGKKIAYSASVSLPELLSDGALNPDKQLPPWYDKTLDISSYYQTDKSVKPDANGNPEQIRAYLAENEQAKKAKYFTRIQFQTETATSNELRFSHIYVINATHGSTAKLLTKGFNNHSLGAFENNNTLYIGLRINIKHPDDESFQSIGKIDLDKGITTTMLSTPKSSFLVEAISKSGKWLIYQTSLPGTVNVPQYFIRNLKANQVAADIKINLDRSIGDIVFNNNESEIYYTASSNGGSILCRTELKNGKTIRLSSPDQGISDIVLLGKSVLYIRTGYDNPAELYLSDLAFNKTLAISRFNSGWLASKKLSKPERHSFINEQGLTVEYWSMKPTDFKVGNKYPLLLEIHGGPASMWGPGEVAMWHEFQYFCSRGIGVVYGNPRGSSGYGQEFLAANRLDWAEGPTRDVLSSLDKTIQENWVDTTKLLISGGSYGGYLTSWIIAHSNRFLAASSQRGVYDFKTMFGEGNVWKIIPRYYDKYPWEDGANSLLWKQSPFTYVDKINTPLLIFAGENDGRVGVAQSDMLYKALKVLGKNVEYVRHPGASHEMVRSGDPVQRIDQMLRTYEFFDRYINKPDR